ncbi:MAG: SHOCT domain-containing protein [Actinomycetes bacterium]
MMYGYDVGAQNWLLMLVMMTAMTALTVVAVIGIVRGLRTDRDNPTAEEVLDERYARGEISSEEYRERKQQLGRR